MKLRYWWVPLTLALAVLGSLETWPPAHAQFGSPTTVRCNQGAVQAASTAALATLFAGVSGKVIYICGWHVTSSAGTASTFQFSSGTGTNCGTTNVNITPAFNVTSTAPSADHTENAFLSLQPGNNLCVISSTTSLQIEVWVAQF